MGVSPQVCNVLSSSSVLNMENVHSSERGVYLRVRFQALTAANMKVTVLWDVAMYGLV
jgi:hypothetical protein